MTILWNDQRHTWHQTVWNIKFPHFLFICWKENRSGRGTKWLGMVKALYHSTVLNLYRNASLHVQRESYQQKLETNQDIEEIPASSYKISGEALHWYLDVSGLHGSTTEHSLYVAPKVFKTNVVQPVNNGITVKSYSRFLSLISSLPRLQSRVAAFGMCLMCMKLHAPPRAHLVSWNARQRASLKSVTGLYLMETWDLNTSPHHHHKQESPEQFLCAQIDKTLMSSWWEWECLSSRETTWNNYKYHSSVP